MALSLTAKSIVSSFNNLSAGSGGAISLGGFNLNLPGLSLSNTSIEGDGIGGWIASSGSALQLLTNGARGVYCIGVLLTDPTMLLNALKMVGEYFLTAGLNLINDIYKACIARVNNILASVYGIVLSYYNTIKNVIGAVKSLGALWQKIKDAWNNRSGSIFDELFKREDCDYFIANMMRCIISKMLDPYLNKFKIDALQKINNFAGDIEDGIFDATAAPTAISNYANTQATFVNKFSSQVSSYL